MIYEIKKNGEKAPHPLKVSSLSEQGWREKDLEDFLFRHLRQLVSTDRMVIGQPSAGEKADLVALDLEGELWLFELKKVSGKAANRNFANALPEARNYGFPWNPRKNFMALAPARDHN